MKLMDWQQSFVDDYYFSGVRKSLLISALGAGRSITALSAAKKYIQNGRASGVIVISGNKTVQRHWAKVARHIGLNLDVSDNVDQLGTSLTYQSVDAEDKNFANIIKKNDCIFILDEVDRYSQKADQVADNIISLNPNNKLLCISAFPVKRTAFDWKYELGREYIYQPETLYYPEVKLEIAQYSPSLALLERLRSPDFTLEGLSWRQFEILISELLESDGYKIDLMQGTKDGGVDVVAVKDMAEAGLYKTVWQAKKNKLSNKVGIATIRELADVRNEFGASKGILVTSSFLTRGALKRVHRDQYILGKVDRNDLRGWINRKLFE